MVFFPDTTDTGRKVGADVPLLGEGSWDPSNTMSPGPRPTFVQSSILVHPAVRPQPTWAENWGLAPFFFGKWEGEPSPHLTECGRGRGLPLCQVSS